MWDTEGCQCSRDSTRQKHPGWFSFIANSRNSSPILHSKGCGPFSSSSEDVALSSRVSRVNKRTSEKEDSRSRGKERGTGTACPSASASDAHTSGMASLVRLCRYCGRPGTLKVQGNPVTSSDPKTILLTSSQRPRLSKARKQAKKTKQTNKNREKEVIFSFGFPGKDTGKWEASQKMNSCAPSGHSINADQ